jgi:hypothetical protein
MSAGAASKLEQAKTTCATCPVDCGLPCHTDRAERGPNRSYVFGACATELRLERNRRRAAEPEAERLQREQVYAACRLHALHDPNSFQFRKEEG